MTRKRSFEVVINLATDDPEMDLGAEEDEVYYALCNAIGDLPTIAYISRPDGQPAEWTEDE